MAYKLSDRKLSIYQAQTIRELNSQGVGQAKLAKMYDVTRGTIKAILQGKTYKTKEEVVEMTTKALLNFSFDNPETISK